MSLLTLAQSLPLSPGVYLMKDRSGKIIYVGKSKALRNRVSQYFQENADHNRKTAMMVSQVSGFETILTDTEMEALSLENRLIKLHNPKYNIRLKDAKSYPYIKVTLDEDYPRMLVVRNRLADKAAYFGPYSGISTAYAIVGAARKCFGIPSCKHKFPEKIGKVRPCLNYQMHACPGICTGQITKQQYRETIDDLLLFLRGDIRQVENKLTEKMEFAAENLMFEAAAVYRDRIAALSRLRQKQKIIASPDVEYDVYAMHADPTCTILTAFYVRGGMVSDSESFRFGAEQIVDSETITTFLCDLYEKRTYLPRQILLGFDPEEEQLSLLSDWLHEKAGYKVTISHPLRGDKKALCDLVAENAQKEASRFRFEQEQEQGQLSRLATLLGLSAVPKRIESYDISNLGSEQITAGKVSMVGTRFDKSAYRTYKIRSVDSPDDYASMREAIARRLAHNEDPYPDLILLDGGKGHVSVIASLLRELQIDIPVFGMVKDEYHKTRALVGEAGEISIAAEQSVYVLLYRLQEEVHRYTVSRMQKAKRKTLKTSSLEQIPGIGPAKAKALLAHFGSISALKEADAEALCSVKGIGIQQAEAILAALHQD